jgi:hypothetical protein
MIDPATGILKFAHPLFEVAPSLKRARFVASGPGRRAKILVRNEPYCSWCLDCESEDGSTFSVSLCFRGATLEQVDLVVRAKKYGTSWEDWTLAKERARQAAHDVFLRHQLGNRRKFEWGEVESQFNPKDGISAIVLTYARPKRSKA